MDTRLAGLLVLLAWASASGPAAAGRAGPSGGPAAGATTEVVIIGTFRRFASGKQTVLVAPAPLWLPRLPQAAAPSAGLASALRRCDGSCLRNRVYHPCPLRRPGVIA